MPGKLAFIYPGQGAQHIGMGKDAHERYPSVREAFRAASGALGEDVERLVFDGVEEELMLTANTQPAMLATCWALTQPLLGAGVCPDVAAGLSVGEYAAHVAAGTIGFADAMRVVRLRGQMMQGEVPAGEGAMAAVIGLDEGAVRACCEEAAVALDGGAVVEPANFNCPGQVVIAGHTRAVEAAAALCSRRGAKRAAMLAVSAPFHCSLLAGAGEKLARALEGIALSPMRIPVVANATAELVDDAAEVKGLLARQISSPVLWERSVRAMVGAGVGAFVEIGPGKTLAGFVRRIDKTAAVYNVSDVAGIEAAIGALAPVRPRADAPTCQRASAQN